LHALGRWLHANGEGIFGTKPWTHASAKSPDGIDIRFTRKGESLYAFLLGRPAGAEIAIPALAAKRDSTISLLGTEGALRWSNTDGKIVVNTGELPGEHAWGLKITPVPESA